MKRSPLQHIKTSFSTLLQIVVLALLSAGFAYAEDAGHAVFVSGKVEMAGKTLTLNSAITEGAELSTGADGYLYIKTIDNGFFILRPNSRGRIATYHIDHANPANTRIKLELIDGVARSISGEAVKLARQNFRFNTPVAAIGVRGTDFVVYTTQETSRITVLSGGVVVSGFASGCSPQGYGPCEGGASAELFARQQGQLMQITKDQAKPQLLQSNGSAPDIITPPRSDEPGGKAGGVSGNNGGSGAAATNSAPPTPTAPISSTTSAAPASGLNTPSASGNGSSSTDVLDAQRIEELRRAIVTLPINTPTPPIMTPPPPPPPVVPEPNQIIWGRWATVLGQAPTINISQYLSTEKIIDSNSYFALFRLKSAEWRAPTSGTWGFALNDSEAYITNRTANSVSVAKVQNASLNIDFTNANFMTNFDLLSGNETFKHHAEGRVYADGQFTNASSINSSTIVNGVLSNQNGGNAAYTFQSRIDDNRTASGITIWGRVK
jgi:hypothetical protein